MPDTTKLAFEAVRLIEETGGGLVRLMGSIALAVRCKDFLFLWDILQRDPIIDIDLVALPSNEKLVRKILPQFGYSEDPAFNYRRAAYKRLVYFNHSNQNIVEIFIDPLPFHHTIEIDERFFIDKFTVSPSDLFILKIQYESIQKRQLIDLCLLLAAHEISKSDDSEISLGRIVQLVEDDWGLWRTTSINIRKLASFARQELIQRDATLGSLVSSRIEQLSRAIQYIEKDSNWRVQDALHRAFPCLKAGRPVDDPTEDRWSSFRRY